MNTVGSSRTRTAMWYWCVTYSLKYDAVVILEKAVTKQRNTVAGIPKLQRRCEYIRNVGMFQNKTGKKIQCRFEDQKGSTLKTKM
jgi:hypothetical protein